jgi:hypothetical protein
VLSHFSEVELCKREVRRTPVTDIVISTRHVRKSAPPDSYIKAIAVLFDHLVGAGEKRWWHCKA